MFLCFSWFVTHSAFLLLVFVLEICFDVWHSGSGFENYGGFHSVEFVHVGLAFPGLPLGVFK